MLNEHLQIANGDNEKTTLDEVIVGFNNLTNIGFEDFIKLEARLSDPLQLLRFYDHVTHEFVGPGTEKTIHPSLWGYMKGQRIKAINSIELSLRTDHLTSLPNRVAYQEGIESILSRAERGLYTDSKKVALIFIDINKFKEVNDNHGHEFGDEVLRYVAEGVRACVRSGDLRARISGDEFVIVLDGMTYRTLEDAESTLRDITLRINNVLQNNIRYRHPKKRVEVSVSAGMSILGVDAHTGQELHRNADNAMYHAKLNPVAITGVSSQVHYFVYKPGIEYIPRESRRGRL